MPNLRLFVRQPAAPVAEVVKSPSGSSFPLTALDFNAGTNAAKEGDFWIDADVVEACKDLVETDVCRHVAVAHYSGGGEPIIREEAGPTPDMHRPLVTEFASTGELRHLYRVDGMLIAAVTLRDGDNRIGSCTVAAENDDERRIMSSARRLGRFVQMARRNRKLQIEAGNMLQGLLRSLVSAVDANDAYTCGHSLRVALYARQLGEAAGLVPTTLDRIYLAGLLHDIGKIGVDTRVLRKAGRLTDDEFAQIRQHPVVGHHILSGIPQVHDVLPGVLHHHERYDGRGYPHKLAGADIPLMARILAVADSFDAMTSDRNYRHARPAAKALAEVAQCAGTQFDPTLAKLFCRLPLSELESTIKRGRASAEAAVAA